MTWPVLATTHFGSLGPLGVNFKKYKILRTYRNKHLNIDSKKE